MIRPRWVLRLARAFRPRAFASVSCWLARQAPRQGVTITIDRDMRDLLLRVVG